MNGWTKLDGCPVDTIPADVWDALRAADLADSGLMPVGGGWLDQSAQGLDAIRMVQSERHQWEASQRAE